jgi:hypothetical protein
MSGRGCVLMACGWAGQLAMSYNQKESLAADSLQTRQTIILDTNVSCRPDPGSGRNDTGDGAWSL